MLPDLQHRIHCARRPQRRGVCPCQPDGQPLTLTEEEQLKTFLLCVCPCQPDGQPLDQTAAAPHEPLVPLSEERHADTTTAGPRVRQSYHVLGYIYIHMY